ncbi:protein sprouty [Cylas formicarius]|uniref:protein sprouty n=1 Tax=Cylas formicarius TaxID=197179 RepID=UPI002958C0FE|nr:protein sprouty [Cylas formicarius]XP_060530978.1 protein sprouty [Cylas formicarius]XP_060530980.1 protein sprouty [Cylas formicarius]
MDHQHGGPEAKPPRGAHRPQAPVMSAPAPLTAPLAPLLRPLTVVAASAPVVSLTAPRPENERSGNEYVEAPFRTPIAPPPPPPPPPRPHHRPPAPPAVVKHQPTLSFGKASNGGGGECAARPSIMCPECGRCRCESCQQPRPLPQRWVCNGGCLLSADTVVDYASCLCCVKGLFYHCSDADGQDGGCADAPCGCAPDRRVARWGCLAALACVLPCLWLYWPLRGGKRAVELCYARHSRQGCRCRQPPHASAAAAASRRPPNKRLLDADF